MEKITVIGGSGFVGTNFCQKLADRKVDFEIIDLKTSRRFPEKCKIADVRDIVSLRESITGSIVVNLAAVHRDDIRDISSYFKTNVQGAENVAKVCSEKDIKKIVFTSSVAVYGFAKPGTDEQGPINPFNEYGRTKFQAEEKLRQWLEKGKNSLIIVRPTVIFGEGNRGNVFNLLSQIASGKFVMIGNGKNRKSMAYIGNIAAFLEKCVETEKSYAIYNYVDTPDFDMNTLVYHVRRKLTGKTGIGPRIPYWIGLMIGYLADAMTAVTAKKLPLSSIRVKKFCSSTEFSTTKHELDNFRPPYTLRDGLDRTIQNEFISPKLNSEEFYTE